MDFGSHTDRVVSLAAALVNVATPGQRQGREHRAPEGAALAAALGEALPSHSWLGGPAPGEVVGPLVELAGLARAVFDAADSRGTNEAAAAVNVMLARYRPSPLLEAHDGQPYHLHFHGPEAADPSGWGGGVSVGLATVLGSEYADRLGVCSAPACDRVFVDTSRNGTRRFCSLPCQNRVKAAAHRARARTP